MNDIINIALVGDNKSGKTAFALRKTIDQFSENYEPSLEDSYETEIILKDKTKIKVKIFDTAGQDDFKSLRDKYLESSDAFIVVFSLTDQSSLRYAEEALKDLKYLHENGLKAVLVGNDCNSPNRKLKYDQGKQLADSYNIKYIETSAKENINVEEAFQVLFSYFSESPSKKKCRI